MSIAGDDTLHRPGGRRLQSCILPCGAGALACHVLGLQAQKSETRAIGHVKAKKSLRLIVSSTYIPHPRQTNRKTDPRVLQCERKVGQEKALLAVQRQTRKA